MKQQEKKAAETRGKGSHSGRLFSRVFPSFHWNSLWVIMVAVTLLLSLAAVVAIILLVFRHADDTIDQSAEQNNSQIVSNVAVSIDAYISEMVSISDEVAKLVETYPPEEWNNNLFVFLRDDVETIAVFDTNGELVLTTDQRKMRGDMNLTRQSWFAGASADEDGYLLSQPHVQRLYRGEYPWVITLTRGVSWEQGTQRHNGIIVVDMNFTRIKDLCARDLEDEGYLYLADNTGRVVYHPRQQMIYAGILPDEVIRTSELGEGSARIQSGSDLLAVCAKTLSSASWRVIGVTPLKGLATYDGGLGGFAVWVVALLSVAVLGAGIIISSVVVRPLYQLMALMSGMTDAENMRQAPTGGVYEAGQLGEAFNRMAHRIRQLMQQVREEQKQLHRSEMKALNAQINPHFLYNTLDSVVWLAESGDQKSVVQMVLALAKYFRLSLSGAKDYITVKNELDQVENYLVIQKMRFGDSFTYRIACDEAAAQLCIPKILLQPIVENAIVHGVGLYEEGGAIEISATLNADRLVLAVRDNGCGIRQEQLVHILETDPEKPSGIGLKNVHQRIQLACGAQYGAQVESELDEGTVVRLYLPVWTEMPGKGERL